MATGIPLIFSTCMDPKSSQLAAVVLVLVLNMFAGVNPRLSQIIKMGYGPHLLSTISYARWLDESLFTSESELYSDAWKFPPAFYKSLNDSVVSRLLLFSYTEHITLYNVVLMIWMGIFFRLVSYVALIASNRSQRSLPTMTQMCIKNVFEPFEDLITEIVNTIRGKDMVAAGVLSTSERDLIGELRNDVELRDTVG